METCSAQNMGCSHNCSATPSGPICTCPVGKVLNDTKSCIGELVYIVVRNIYFLLVMN